MEPEQICDAISSNLAEVVHRWSILTEGLPWGAIAPEHRCERIPEVILGLARAALCAPANQEGHREQIWMAAAHGVHRREQGLAEAILLAEYSLLRQAMWSYIRDLDASADQALEAVSRLDLAVTLATQAAMHGYHRDEMERLGLWPDKIEQLALASPLLQSRLPPC